MTPTHSNQRPLFALACALFSAAAAAQPAPAVSALRDLRWRAVGPLRGGRTKAAAGVPSRPGTFYIGAVNGGVFKTNDYGRTWLPIFDEQPSASIGAIAVAPSNPDILYVGSGEGLQRPDLSTGDGLYKSVDGGKSWRHLGLRDGQQIPQIAVDPRDPNRLFVAVLGHPYGPNEERGIFRSLDGGETFTKVLYKDPDTGGIEVVLDPADPQIVYAALWESREAPWENGSFNGPGSGLFKSTDGGTSWRQIGKGLPDYATDELGRIGLGIAPSNPRRIFATVHAKKTGGLYRSDDAGETFAQISEDKRVAERADDFAEVKVHPLNPEIVFTAAVVVWKSVDGGKTFSALRGAPGGDDYQRIYIDPKAPDTMLVASDQGAIITVNGGESWSSWYNQPTAQMFHVAADYAFPYRLCGAQQESGSACVNSRGPDGSIGLREWHPVGIEEYGYAAPDPLDPEIIYGGKVSRHDRRTGQTLDISPFAEPRQDYRTVRTQPLVFSPLDPHTLYFASNTVWKTVDSGKHWTQLSPDLTRKSWDPPPGVGKYRGQDPAKPTQRGVIYALAPSPLDKQLIWAGTDDGLIQVTRDGGKSWHDVTPPSLKPWAKVSVLEASHFDKATAYAAINTLRLDDLTPHLLRTRDGGKSWQEVVAGLEGVADVVREDPKRKGLLYAGTERSVFVSLDDGEEWQSLRLNLPATSIRDLIIKDDDLAIATHGRGFYILDDISPLRELKPGLTDSTHLFKPAKAYRVRWNTNTDTPLPPDEPAGPNPPDGAIIDYSLKAAGPVALEIRDAAGKLVRRYSSDDPVPPLIDEENIPRYWIRPVRVPSGAPGVHRFVWDLHGAPPAVEKPQYSIAAVPGDTPREPRGPWALPGRYEVRLIAGGETQTAPLEVAMDPRVKTPLPALQQQLDLSQRLLTELGDSRAARERLHALQKTAGPELQKKLALLDGSDARRERPWDPIPPPTFGRMAQRLLELFEQLQQADAAPTPQTSSAAQNALKDSSQLRARLKALE